MGNSGLLARNKGHCDSTTCLQLHIVRGVGSHTHACSQQDIWQHLCFYSAEQYPQPQSFLILSNVTGVCVCGGDQIQLRIDCKVRYIGYSEKESFLAKRSKFSSKIPILAMAKLLLILCAPMCVSWGLKPSYARAIDAKHMP